MIAEDAVLRPRTRAAIERTLNAGIYVVLVTGRMFQSVRRYALEAGIENPVVCYQGAVVADPVGGHWLRHVPIPLELARETIAALKDEGFSPNCYVDDELYVEEVTPEARRYADFQHLQLHEVGNLLEWLDRPPTKLVVIDDPEVLDDLKQRMLERFAGRLYISKSLPYFLEFASPEVTKAAGLDFLAEQLGFSRERTVAFGDGENDIELVDWAGYGVAVENADDAREEDRGLHLPVGRRRGSGSGARGLPRLPAMIDLRAARNDPEGFRLALARKGAARGLRRATRRRPSSPRDSATG